MKPIDYRNETWKDVEARVDLLRREVYLALEKHGPCTTRALALACGIDLLTVRPRISELYSIGLVELSNPENRGSEGIYQTVPWPVAHSRFEKEKIRSQEKQLSLL